MLQLSDDNGVALGLITALQFGPSLLLSMYGGVLADRYDKRRHAAGHPGADGRCSRSRSAILVATDVVELWHVFVLAFGLGAVAADRRPGPAGVRLGDGRARAAGQRRQPELDDLQRRPAGRARRSPGCSSARPGATPPRPSSSTRPASRSPSARWPGMRADELRPSPPVARAAGQLRAGLAYTWAHPRPDAGDGARVRHRHLRLQLPGHHRPDVPRGVRPGRRGVRAALHVLRRRLAERGAAVHPAQRPARGSASSSSRRWSSACSRSSPG